MTTLIETLTKATKKTTAVKNRQIFKDAWIEYAESKKTGEELIFCKGYDEHGLVDTVLLNTDCNFTKTEFAVAVNIRESDKGKVAGQVLKLTKADFDKLSK